MAYNPANPFQDKAAGNSGDPYDYARQKATQDAGNGEAQGLDAITRRFAAMGNLNSGAYVKAQEDVHRTAQDEAQNNIGQSYLAEQSQALPYAQMAQQQSQFGQSLGEQQAEFAGGQAMKGRSLDLEASQQALDSKANALNYQLGQSQLSKSGGLFGGGGFAGLGF